MALCVGTYGDPPMLRKGIVTGGYELVDPGDFIVYVRDPRAESKYATEIGLSMTRSGWGGPMRDSFGLERLTLADVAVGKTVLYLMEDSSQPIEYRHGDSKHYDTIKMPGLLKIQEAAVFPASACAGLRD